MAMGLYHFTLHHAAPGADPAPSLSVGLAASAGALLGVRWAAIHTASGIIAKTQAHVCAITGCFHGVCAHPESCSKRMTLGIVLLICRNEDLVQWVLHGDCPRGKVLSQNESYS